MMNNYDLDDIDKAILLFCFFYLFIWYKLFVIFW